MDYLLRNKIESGVYKIRPLKNESSFSVYCDQDTGSGGWLNIGGGDNGAVTFNDKTFKVCILMIQYLTSACIHV